VARRGSLFRDAVAHFLSTPRVDFEPQTTRQLMTNASSSSCGSPGRAVGKKSLTFHRRATAKMHYLRLGRPRGPPKPRETCKRTSHTIGARIIAPRGHTGIKRPFAFQIESSHPKEHLPPFRKPSFLVRKCLDTLDDTGGLVRAKIENSREFRTGKG
jgi:hypothetical protein